ncbi:Protein Mut11 [Apostasia shenzhenica]|uniref:Protein Mut11 n=1 Tax=Apostasia shenzhenica TaxID=1088818 RepID=A0A2I0AT88_9ASPA|nr:Protein Mut11 [Apostasia shenzhenica]
MSHRWIDDAKFVTSTSSTVCSNSQFSFQSTLRNRNICELLSRREIAPRAKRSATNIWGGSLRASDLSGKKCDVIDARNALTSWVEAESLNHLTAKYCPLLPPPRSTIAAAFSSDGKILASTHGDHTVKIIDCRTGKCLKVLSGHRRTPWVVRFHPLCSEILASGSLDHEVRLWDARTADCIGSRDFYRPIASIAFHAQGELLAVASGHKLYIWSYNRRGEASSPTIVLKTRRSLRAVHFHPHAAPFLLTAEVNDLDSPDSPLTLATTSGYLQYPPPTVFFANISSSLRSHLEAKVPLLPSPFLFWPSFLTDDGRATLQHVGRAGVPINNQQSEDAFLTNQSQASLNRVTPMELTSAEMDGSKCYEDSAVHSLTASMQASNTGSVVGNMDSHSNLLFQPRHSGSVERPEVMDAVQPPVAIRIPFRQTRPGVDSNPATSSLNFYGNAEIQMLLRSMEGGQVDQLMPASDSTSWEVPFLQGWLMGQSHAGLQSFFPANVLHGNLSTHENGPNLLANQLYRNNMEALLASSTTSTPSHSRGTGRPCSRNRARCRTITSVGAGEGSTFPNAQNNDADAHSAPAGIETEISSSLAAAAAAELPCTVKLRIWPHDVQDPCNPLYPEKCRLTIPHAVLCSEMGAHFSPCGRFLVACVACMLPHLEGDLGLHSQMNLDTVDASTSPTRHPLSAHQIMYELRVYSLEEATFGAVLASRAIRAAHCLTSIQFSPTSEHILLAYGRRHSSLLRSILIDGETAIPIYTILEVYRVSDMELVRVLPSAEDEVNVACFHPLPGGGLVYGTKEGKLRILHYDSRQEINSAGSNMLVDENMLEMDHFIRVQA